ncbi:MAG TPA: NAD-dependent epimerase/dehydratase family protein [Bryobacteraceae bacterium]|nr:NAD-dependent epimerase/dehydratase family protein [Bryobacteraceae bacterium]
MPDATVLICGCGYTGRRVAERLLAAGYRVIGTTRSGKVSVPGIDSRALHLPHGKFPGEVPEGVIVLHSIPVIETSAGPADPTPCLLRLLDSKPSRLVYLSTTSVYGVQRDVDERTLVAPASDRARLRVAAERSIATGPWSSLILRPAAIYGPGRGVHVKLARGEWHLAGDGSNYVSRIHVDDLAALTAAALLRPDVTGAFPAADEEPCAAAEITRFCAELLRLPLPPATDAGAVHATRKSDRRVDGRAVLRLLGLELKFPSYRRGIPASLAA